MCRFSATQTLPVRLLRGQQTQDVGPMLVYVGPASANNCQKSPYVFYYLLWRFVFEICQSIPYRRGRPWMVSMRYSHSLVRGDWALYYYSIPTNTRHLPNAVSMLAHRLRRWCNIETALGECRVCWDRRLFTMYIHTHSIWIATVAQHQTNIGPMSLCLARTGIPARGSLGFGPS